MAKYRLDETPAESGMAAFGISSHVPDYRVCWALNRALGLSLARRREDIVEAVRGKELHYPVFTQQDDAGLVTWALVSNACGQRRLVPGHKEADYFLLVEEETARHEEDLLGRLRAADLILMAFPVAWGSLHFGHKLLL